MYFSNDLAPFSSVSLVLVYIRNFDTCRKPNSLVTQLLKENGFDLAQIYFFSSLGRWCTQLIISQSYFDEFSLLVAQLSKKNQLPQTYRLYVDLSYNPLLPLSYDYNKIKTELGSEIRLLLETNSKKAIEIHYQTAYKLAKNSVIKEFFLKTIQELGLKQSTCQNITIPASDLITYDKEFCHNISALHKHQVKIPATGIKKESNIPINQMKANWNTLSIQHIDAILPTLLQHRLIVYTDGASKLLQLNANNLNDKAAQSDSAGINEAETQSSSAGIGIYFASNVNKFPSVCTKLNGSITSAQAELQAVSTALKTIISTLDQFSSYSEIWICSDSRYVVDGVNLHFKTWKKLLGKNSKGKTISNYSTFSLISDYCSILTVNGFSLFFHYMPSHSGIDGNEIANLLAHAALML
ncbi:hypothetical protein BB561_005665 [Smittium simulii]|uniref:ribonuclease H n=1 Tax=Smittium simulii TaxID=133385 RepID=A0A2T9Y974_9FUNG|nr:hypothetical protein BB561_005665 [Smittium simulii]